jgi:hypothetical protein
VRHIVVIDRIGLPVIPFDGDFAPRRSDDGTKIAGRRVPTDAVANFKKPGLFAGHFDTTVSRPLPRHSLHGGGKILRPGCVG